MLTHTCDRCGRVDNYSADVGKGQRVLTATEWCQQCMTEAGVVRTLVASYGDMIIEAWAKKRPGWKGPKFDAAVADINKHF